MKRSYVGSITKFFLERDPEITEEKLHLLCFLVLGKSLEDGLVEFDSLPEYDIPIAVPDNYIETLNKDKIEKRKSGWSPETHEYFPITFKGKVRIFLCCWCKQHDIFPKDVLSQITIQLSKLYSIQAC